LFCCWVSQTVFSLVDMEMLEAHKLRLGQVVVAQESKAPVVPAQIVPQRHQFAQNMDSASAVHIRLEDQLVVRE